MSHSLAAVYSGFPGQIALQQIRTPTPRSGEVLVRVLGCTLCGSDLHSLEGRRAVPIPTILGTRSSARSSPWGVTLLRPTSRAAPSAWGVV